MLQRSLYAPLTAALGDTPIVFLHGARQTGKTTLVRSLLREGHEAAYLTLDEARLLEAAISDPEGFIERLVPPVIIDEVQLASDLFRAIKARVDRDRRPGSFLLTGSAHLLVLPRLAESLVGRMEVLTLWPLAQSEIEGRKAASIDALFSAAALPVGETTVPAGGTPLIERLVRGGYPEASARHDPARRGAWFESYLTTLLQRDVRDLANIDGLRELPHLLRLLAARASTLLNVAELGRSSGIAATTLKRYLGLLEGTFLLQRVPPWSTNLSKQMVKAPKVALIDSGLVCHLQGLDARRLADEPQLFGPVLENFVLQELRAQIGWGTVRPRLFHYRTHKKEEIDLLLEDAAGRVVAVEIKARASVRARDFKAMKSLAEALGDRFLRGVVLYTGPIGIPFGERLHALPVEWLWSE